jgi:hypothetical protein
VKDEARKFFEYLAEIEKGHFDYRRTLSLCEISLASGAVIVSNGSGQQMTAEPRYTSRLGDIGKSLGLSAAEVGKLLIAAGLRTEKGYLTPKAITEGFARERWTGEDRLREWNIAKIVGMLANRVIA